MVVKLLPDQIVNYWDAIKFATVKSDEVDGRYLEGYLTNLLSELMNNKAQCFVRLDSEKVLQTVMITKILLDKVTEQKTLVVENLYAYQNVHREVWKNDLDILLNFMREEKCMRVLATSKNHIIWKLCEELGFKELNKTYVFNL